MLQYNCLSIVIVLWALRIQRKVKAKAAIVSHLDMADFATSAAEILDVLFGDKSFLEDEVTMGISFHVPVNMYR